MIDITVIKPYIDLKLEVEKRKTVQITMSNGKIFTSQILKCAVNPTTGNVGCIYLNFVKPIILNADQIISIEEV